MPKDKGEEIKIYGTNLKEVVKRDGSREPFDASKISAAIGKAFEATGVLDGEKIKPIVSHVVKALDEKFGSVPAQIEEIQDVVEAELAKTFPKVAKAYILYRETRKKIRDVKAMLGVQDDLKLSINAIKVLRSRYLVRDEKGQIIETPSELFRRVAGAVALADKKYDDDGKKSEEEFYEAMSQLEFLPNSPTLMNAGRRIGQLSACFVLPIGDSLPEIFQSLSQMAQIHQSGGGTGFSFSRLRPKGDLISSTMGEASGPVSFMEVFDKATSVIKQGGKRRGANMGILRVDHPDIIDFITAKSDPDHLMNFNISVAATDDFMKAVEAGRDYSLINPKNGLAVKKMNSRAVFDLIASQAWKSGDPGLIFIDRINQLNPTKFLGKIESTNPCGEQPLHNYESCNLGSINLVKFIDANQKDFDWKRLEGIIRLAVHFLDNVIDVNKFPFEEIRDITLANRRIGLGVMGWADALATMAILYDSNMAFGLAEKTMRFIAKISHDESSRIGRKRGSFPNFQKSTWRGKYRYLRNATTTTIAPTGTISIIAGVSSGIEPFFALAFVRSVLEGARLFETNTIFEKSLGGLGILSQEILRQIGETGSCQKIEIIPKQIKDVFKIASDIDYAGHIKMQAAFQRYTDNAVSKTINLPESATPEEVRSAYMFAYKFGCKGVTVYRYNSRPQQVLYITADALDSGQKLLTAHSEFAGGCPEPYCPF